MSSKKITFKIKCVLSPEFQECKTIGKIKNALDHLSFGSLVESPGLASLVKLSRSRVYSVSAEESLEPYRCKVGRNVYWGSKKTIKSLLKKMHENNQREQDCIGL